MVEEPLENPEGEAMKNNVDLLWIVHPGSQNVWKCPMCSDINYGSNALLKRHYKVYHSGLAMCYICEDCGTTSDNARSIGTHKRYC